MALRPEQVPPPIPGKKKGPPPIPGKRKGPPPIPKKASGFIEDELQRLDAENAVEIDVSDFEEANDSNISEQVAEADPSKRESWQKMEMVRGSIPNFDGNSLIQFEMRKDLEKREGETPGEDMFIADKETGLTGVLDGMGGEISGDKASIAAAEALPDAYKKAKSSLEKKKADKAAIAKEMNDFLESQVAFVHPDQRQAAKQELIGKGYSGSVILEAMALRSATIDLNDRVAEKTLDKASGKNGKSTMIVGKTVETSSGKKYEVISAVGDGLAFKIDKDGKAELLTKEQTYVDYLISEAALTPEQAKDPNFSMPLRIKNLPMEIRGQVGDLVKQGVITSEQAQDPEFVIVGDITISKMKSMTLQSLGMDKNRDGTEVKPQLTITELNPGDRVVYLTDGISDMQEYLTDGAFDAQKAADRLMAQQKSGDGPGSLAQDATRLEASLKDLWAAEQARKTINQDYKPDKKFKPKLDEKTELIKTIG